MSSDVPGLAPDHDYEPSYCNQALLDAGLPLIPPPTGVTYTSDEIARIARGYRLGRMNVITRRGPSIGRSTRTYGYGWQTQHNGRGSNGNHGNR